MGAGPGKGDALQNGKAVEGRERVQVRGSEAVLVDEDTRRNALILDKTGRGVQVVQGKGRGLRHQDGEVGARQGMNGGAGDAGRAVSNLKPGVLSLSFYGFDHGSRSDIAHGETAFYQIQSIRFVPRNGPYRDILFGQGGGGTDGRATAAALADRRVYRHDAPYGHDCAEAAGLGAQSAAGTARRVEDGDSDCDRLGVPQGRASGKYPRASGASTSRSMRRVRAVRARARARWTAIVVLPVPPSPLATAITRSRLLKRPSPRPGRSHRPPRS